jgi:hypothetical protein
MVILLEGWGRTKGSPGLKHLIVDDRQLKLIDYKNWWGLHRQDPKGIT